MARSVPFMIHHYGGRAWNWAAHFSGPGRRTDPLALPAMAAAMAIAVIVAAGLALPYFLPGAAADEALSMAGVALLLLGGVPHGAFDLHLAVAAGRTSVIGSVRFAAVYLAIGGALALLWWLVPGAALALFLVIGAIHFAEDWQCLPAPLALALGISPLALAALAHADAVGALFAAMAGPIWGHMLANLLLMIAPVAVLMALVGLLLAVTHQGRARPMAMLAALVAVALLPPALGFATFFSLVHAPRHMAALAARLCWSPRQLAQVGGGMTMLAFALTAPVWAMVTGATAAGTNANVAAAFIILSLLAMPHQLLAGRH